MRLVEIFKMVGESSRLRIINLLLVRPHCVYELQEILELPQVTVSKHMSKLRENNIVTSEKIAQRVFYSLTDEIKNNYSLVCLIKSNRHDVVLAHDINKEKKINKREKDYKCPTN